MKRDSCLRQELRVCGRRESNSLYLNSASSMSTSKDTPSRKEEECLYFFETCLGCETKCHWHTIVPFIPCENSLPYNYLVGGVFAISKEHLIQVNGYSNLYWGWGAEDDDMAHRFVKFFLSCLSFDINYLSYVIVLYSKRRTTTKQIKVTKSPDNSSSCLHWKIHDDQTQSQSWVSFLGSNCSPSNGKEKSFKGWFDFSQVQRRLQEEKTSVHSFDDRNWTHSQMALSNSQ